MTDTTTVYMPLEEAIQAAALQNRDRDIRVLGPVEVAKMSQQVYIDEATHMLLVTGENWVPDFPDHPHIKVKK